MSGEDIRKKLIIMGVEQQKIAERMGLSKQNFSATLKTQNVKSGFIEELCKALDMSISDFYGEASTPAANDSKFSEAFETIVSQQQTIRLLSELLAKKGGSAPMTDARSTAAK